MSPTRSKAAAAASAAELDEGRVTEHAVESCGRTITVRLTYPPGYPVGKTAPLLPWLIYLHAGGFVECSQDKSERLARSLAATVPAVVVTPAYSLAPDFPFPAAPEDVFHTASWVLRHARSLKVDKLRFALVGEEAGGNLAIALSQMLRDRGLPEPRAQWLIRPVTDPCLQHASCAGGEGKPSVPLEMLQRLAGYYRDYLPTPAASVHPYAAPVHASRLAGLPPTLVQVAEEDALRAEGQAFADRLQMAGVPAKAQIMPGACGAGVEESHDRCQVWINEGARYLQGYLAGGDDASLRTERQTGASPPG
ncbi:alpha/beta hydrolase [Cupriavidus basilensis]|uniref:Alpha/beta hydrolase n=1 Tax=Cupriavidus basilensis TaxID=68895 RepID=A0ABT6B2D8_9BURK|nr:alpha/beta hydrolase [Cupriavidus basilensis]MDF3838662.1 alpha/beta hydrolase [Cupriavidus basilensis]